MPSLYHCSTIPLYAFTFIHYILSRSFIGKFSIKLWIAEFFFTTWKECSTNTLNGNQRKMHSFIALAFFSDRCDALQSFAHQPVGFSSSVIHLQTSLSKYLQYFTVVQVTIAVDSILWLFLFLFSRGFITDYGLENNSTKYHKDQTRSI